MQPEPTLPRPSPAVNQHPNPPSGPVSLPEWANLPGLTLPPDLSSIPGMGTDSVLPAPTFVESEQREVRELPTLPVFEPPYIPQRPDVQNREPGHSAERTVPPSRDTLPPLPPVNSTAPTPVGTTVPTPAPTPYAPPPVGAQYDVPPPPGMAHVPSSGLVLPPSAFVAPAPLTAGTASLPPVGSVPPAALAPAVDESAPPAPTSRRAAAVQTESAVTVSVWLIAVLPLLQFAVIYLLFKTLGLELAPGMQWGILAAPAAFSLLFANSDRKKLTERGLRSPNLALAIIPPVYLVVRCITTGRSAVLPLVTWVVLQAAAAAGVYLLLPSVLSAAIRAIG